ncbi:MAG: site-2 protease family protein [Pirellulales bacterium]
MLGLLEPKRTNYDLHFRVAGIPVRVHPLFWAITLLMSVRPDTKPVENLLWVVASFASILIHELGHAFTMRWYGYRPWVTLYGFGGLASYDRNEQYGYDPISVFGENYTRYRETRREVLISLAGPAAGFVLAGLIVGVLVLVGGGVEWELGPAYLPQWYFPGVTSPYVATLLRYFLYINIFWGLVNLLPIFPLDGGQIARELFLARQGTDGMRPAFQLGMITGIGMALFAVALWPAEMKLFGAMFFGILAYQNYMLLQAFGRYGGEALERGGRDGDGGSGTRPPRNRGNRPTTKTTTAAGET